MASAPCPEEVIAYPPPTIILHVHGDDHGLIAHMPPDVILAALQRIAALGSLDCADRTGDGRQITLRYGDSETCPKPVKSGHKLTPAALTLIQAGLGCTQPLSHFHASHYLEVLGIPNPPAANEHRNDLDQVIVRQTNKANETDCIRTIEWRMGRLLLCVRFERDALALLRRGSVKLEGQTFPIRYVDVLHVPPAHSSPPWYAAPARLSAYLPASH